MPHSIILNADLSEQVPYTDPQMQFHIAKSDLVFSASPSDMDVTHWHDDIELILVMDGYMDYGVNGKIYHMKAGEGIFINARQIHNGYYAGSCNCTYICILLHPMLLCTNSYIERTFISPVTDNTSFPFRHLHPADPGELAVLNAISAVYEASQNRAPTQTLQLQSLFFQLWARIFEINPASGEIRTLQSTHLSALKSMMNYIQKNCTQKLSLDDIAASANICKSSCSKIFQTYLHQSPIRFLTECRLKKASELLATTDLSITEIAYACGFSGASYFSETFRSYLNCTPTAYRQKTAENVADRH